MPGSTWNPWVVLRRTLVVGGKPALVHLGGTPGGTALLLVHGGWGGAAMHWSKVWEALTKDHHVIAPELPGLGAPEQPALASVAAYVDWLVELLDVLGVERAWCVGSSFGASVAWSLAGRAPARCAGVALVNGVPMPRTPRVLGALGRTRAGAALMRSLVRWVSYRPNGIGRAFADPRHIPAELGPAMRTWPEIVPRFAALLVAGDGPPAPSAPPLLIWGAADQLPGSRIRDGRKLAAELPGAHLVVLDGAGHFPQIETPRAFVSAIESWCR